MSDQPREILHAVTRQVDDTADLLAAAMEQATALEQSLRKHEYAINDLHWDTAKTLLEPNPSRPTLRAVQAGAEQLTEQLRHSTHTAVQIHDTLQAAGQHLQHTDRLIGALAGTSDSVDHAAEVGILSSRAERLTTLVELATPLADRARQQIESAHDALDHVAAASPQRSRDQLQMFWSLDHGVFDAARQIARARTSTRDGVELTEQAVHSGTLTAAHARDLLRLHQQPPPSPTAGGPSGPTF